MTLAEAPELTLDTLIDPAELLAPPRAVFSGNGPAPERTLLDILAETTRRHPNGAAVDDGSTALSYRALAAETEALRLRLAAAGIGAGDRVGIRVPSGTNDLYISILAVLAAGAAYVPVDAEDPEERAELVFSEAGVSAVIGAHREIRPCGTPHGAVGRRPGPDDDAWIIFTSGSTGKPKGVAVSHRSAAAFVDAEAGLFLTEEPIGPGDRVLAGLSVAFDASCEEMWLAWRYGACLVAAPRSLVRTGLDLGPWLVEQRITVVSTVPTLAALWPSEALDDVRLLIFGGEACPPELAERMAVEGREVWNTYGPTEATVVACAAQLTGEGPVRIGLPLDGWDLAVVDARGELVPMGEVGELVIGGVGLARYLDADKDAEKYAPLPSLGWERAYRSGDLVRADAEGLLFVGRADEQIKLGGRRIELGEVDAALQALPNVAGAAAAVRTTRGGNQILVGYVVSAAQDTAADTPAGDEPPDGEARADQAQAAEAQAAEAQTDEARTDEARTDEAEVGVVSSVFDPVDALRRLREALPASLVPLIAVVDTLPTRTSGKVDRAALPWPLPSVDTSGQESPLEGTEGWLAEQWAEILGTSVGTADAEFFAIGGSSLGAARLVALIRARFPNVSVSDIYQNPSLGALARVLEASDARESAVRTVRPTPRRAGAVQLALMLPLLTISGLRWAVGVAALNNVLARYGDFPWAPAVSWWWVALGWLLCVSSAGRVAVAAGGARLLLRGVRPGTYPRGGSVHLRLWTAERLAERVGANRLTGTWITHYARALGARIGADADLHSLPPVTGMLRLGKGCAVEPEVDLSGHWLDGDLLHIGKIRIGAAATVGARSTLFPGARVGKRAEIAPGSGVTGAVPAGQRWSGVPAARSGKAAHRWPGSRPPRTRGWSLVYGLTSTALGLLPALAALPGLLTLLLFVRGESAPGDVLAAALIAVPLATVVSLATYALLVLVLVRALGTGLREGYHAVHSAVAWRAWATERLMNTARVVLFPLYASLFTPVWLRALGMKVGRRVEASTVLALPAMTTVGDGAFLADDTMVATYELGGGWMRIAAARVGKRAFLGNSGMTAPGRSVPKNGLVGVLSSTPKGAKAGSSWLGMPPMKLPRAAEAGDQSRTYDPPRALMVARAAVEVCRVVPVMCTVALAVLFVGAFEALVSTAGLVVAALCGGLLMAAAGLLACVVAAAAKWLLVGRFRTVEHPLWSSFVWRNELADTFVEVLAVPWLVGSVPGTPLMNLWLRTLGARIGRGAWCETYWLPEADLVRVGAGATVNRGCVVQTHLFHDRIMRMDTVTLGDGSTLGPHGIVLPGATVGPRTTIGPASLVMRGESVPEGTRWLGNPIAAWHTDRHAEGTRS
ncbi:Pls/PosA family non-ribosomal peptide synthetase [Streptomyces sp. RKAG337]|uniref:Pls/PosA family non-ribosomal peptide synthetase n=1 Tax=Streptomyces sp. RKAG337 TaxID=2893404 RepID=UPI0020334809|nr:Pls/PosA family non-ribosomal peptide synthetase [Streptomyces sp. RKAG337]MCM2429950.1 amino acid adenylation domain-containing protein [Streptomyces sp. RKAG337]